MLQHIFAQGQIEVELPPEFEYHLAELLRQNVITTDQVFDLFEQIAYFDNNKDWIEDKYQGSYVLICGGKIFSDSHYEQAIKTCRETFPNRLYYATFISK